MADDQRTYSVPSLIKAAYYACTEPQRDLYKKWKLPPVDLQYCCESLFRVLKLNTVRLDGSFEPPGHRRSTFDRLDADQRQEFQNICCEAAHNGHIDCLRFGHEIGVPMFVEDDDGTHSACTRASRTGNLECLVYAHQNRCEFDHETCYGAAIGGHLACLRYAHVNGAHWDTNTCGFAAANGRLDCLSYAHEHGCPWDSGIILSAAMAGHLECMKYARLNGCPWHKDTLIFASKNGCFQYAMENGCPIPHNFP